MSNNESNSSLPFHQEEFKKLLNRAPTKVRWIVLLGIGLCMVSYAVFSALPERRKEKIIAIFFPDDPSVFDGDSAVLGGQQSLPPVSKEGDTSSISSSVKDVVNEEILEEKLTQLARGRFQQRLKEEILTYFDKNASVIEGGGFAPTVEGDNVVQFLEYLNTRVIHEDIKIIEFKLNENNKIVSLEFERQ
ncbi:MAG: hypothetical protein IT258_16630 [Saprospiraceae bacterium]|nr:hypothetical protein [Saprospiraceae bacterium]